MGDYLKQLIIVMMLVLWPSLNSAAADEVEGAHLRWAPGGSGGEPSFGKHIVPLLNRSNCSSRDCHGASGGQEGFRLSLFGYDLPFDYKELTKDTEQDDPEKPHPRVNPADPGESLAILKALDEIDHEGGSRIDLDTWQHKMFLSWVKSGARFDPKTEPKLETLEVLPKEIVLAQGEETEPVTLRVMASFSDGTIEDVTGLTNFSSNNESIVRVTKKGVVIAKGGKGDTSVVAGYGPGITTTQVLAPNPDGLANFPEFVADNPIDTLVVKKLRKLGIHPSALSTDAQFMRRVYLDVIGTLPTPDEARSFLGDASADKRSKLIDALLQREEHAIYWATRWSDWSGNTQHVVKPDNKVTWLWHDWFTDKFRRNVPYDEIVKGIIVATSLEGRTLEEYKAEVDSVLSRISTKAGARKDSFDDGTYGRRKTLDQFWMKRGGTANELSIRSADMFLGIQLNCAECHKHPFDRWTQDDFESFTSFFRVMERRTHDNSERDTQRNYSSSAIYLGYYRGRWNTGPTKRHPPKLLGGEVVGYDFESGVDPRERLWEWMVDPSNPYFSRSIANRLWGHYFGTGIVDPIDDMNEANPPSNSELLDWLARDFVEHDFDLRHLHRRILNSRTYQLSHVPNDTNRTDVRSYSHAQLRRMPAEVIMDAICTVTGGTYIFSSAYVPRGNKVIGLAPVFLVNQKSKYPLQIFGRPKREQTCACERSSETALTQALYLLNDNDLLEKINNPEGKVAELAKRFPEKKDRHALAEEAYLMTLSRYPTAKETASLDRYLENTKSTHLEAVQDIMWSLINVREFIFIK